MQRKDDYAFLDESEFDALKNLLGANAVNEFIAVMIWKSGWRTMIISRVR